MLQEEEATGGQSLGRIVDPEINMRNSSMIKSEKELSKK